MFHICPLCSILNKNASKTQALQIWLFLYNELVNEQSLIYSLGVKLVRYTLIWKKCTGFWEKADDFITKRKMGGFGVMTFTINLDGTLTANTWRFTPRQQSYKLCNPSTCYLITLEISTTSSELQKSFIYLPFTHHKLSFPLCHLVSPPWHIHIFFFFLKMYFLLFYGKTHLTAL